MNKDNELIKSFIEALYQQSDVIGGIDSAIHKALCDQGLDIDPNSGKIFKKPVEDEYKFKLGEVLINNETSFSVRNVITDNGSGINIARFQVIDYTTINSDRYYILFLLDIINSDTNYGLFNFPNYIIILEKNRCEEAFRSLFNMVVGANRLLHFLINSSTYAYYCNGEGYSIKIERIKSQNYEEDGYWGYGFRQQSLVLCQDGFKTLNFVEGLLTNKDAYIYKILPSVPVIDKNNDITYIDNFNLVVPRDLMLMNDKMDYYSKVNSGYFFYSEPFSPFCKHLGNKHSWSIISTLTSNNLNVIRNSESEVFKNTKENVFICDKTLYDCFNQRGIIFKMDFRMNTIIPRIVYVDTRIGNLDELEEGLKEISKMGTCTLGGTVNTLDDFTYISQEEFDKIVEEHKESCTISGSDKSLSTGDILRVGNKMLMIVDKTKNNYLLCDFTNDVNKNYVVNAKKLVESIDNGVNDRLVINSRSSNTISADSIEASKIDYLIKIGTCIPELKEGDLVLYNKLSVNYIGQFVDYECVDGEKYVHVSNTYSVNMGNLSFYKDSLSVDTDMIKLSSTSFLISKVEDRILKNMFMADISFKKFQS